MLFSMCSVLNFGRYCDSLTIESKSLRYSICHALRMLTIDRKIHFLFGGSFKFCTFNCPMLTDLDMGMCRTLRALHLDTPNIRNLIVATNPVSTIFY